MSTPSPTIYIKNLNDKIKKEELRAQLYALFSPYGKILDVVAQKGPKKKGQAFVVFRDLVGATSAMRGLDGELFYDKKMHIEYAKSSSYATRKVEDPLFVPPSFNIHASGKLQSGSTTSQLNGHASKVTVSHAENDQRKRGREDDLAEEGPQSKRGREDEEDDMDMEEDDDTGPQSSAPPAQGQVRPPSALLYCDNLPIEVTDDVLAVLFQQYPGFQTTSLSAPNPTTKSKTAHVRYDTAEQASVAKEALDGFMIKKGWSMGVTFM